MKRIAILAAMPGELKPLVKGWHRERHQSSGSRAVDLWRFAQGDTEWIAACSGPGQQAATRSFAAAEKDGPLVSVYSIGWVGALSASCLPPRAFRVSGVIDSNTGERFEAKVVEPSGWDASIQAHPSDKNNNVARMGHPELWLVTSPRVADVEEKKRLATAYGASLVDMEAAAVARLAAMRGIPFHCIKGVSDGFTEDLPDFNPFISADGHFQTGRLVFFVLFRPWYWPSLIRMGENSKKASRAIRDLLLENLKEPGAIANKNGDTNLTR